MKRVVFLDITCPKPYSKDTLVNEPMGGTEATVVRVAEALDSPDIQVYVGQHNRVGLLPSIYTSFEALQAMSRCPDLVVALRTPKLLPYIRKQWGGVKTILWCHDYNQRELVEHYDLLSEFPIKILGVSRTHATNIKDALLTRINNVKNIKVDFVYNPVAEYCKPSTTPYDKNKFVFFSSPHKGLEKTIQTFERIVEQYPESRLYVANPGYLESHKNMPSFVTDLGQLPHFEMIQHIKNAYCVLHLNDVFPETFGLVHAEANSMGVPVLTGHGGANSEILGLHSSQMLDIRNERAVLDRLEFWKMSGRPKVEGNSNFNLQTVINKWKGIINE